jgi:ribosomal protein L23
MYQLYSDKLNNFECQIQLEGCSLNDANARLIVESDDNSLIFKGSINNDGYCVIPIKKLKNMVSESGVMRLEVIADDMYFSPWESEYNLVQSKKVTVEVKSQTNQNIIKENVKPKMDVKVKNVPNQQRNHTISEEKNLTKGDLNMLLKRLRR